MFRITWPLYVVKRVVVGVVVAAVLVTGTAVGVQQWRENSRECADGVTREGPLEECVGVTDGSSYFEQKHLKDIAEKIRTENDRVVKEEQDYVSVAYMTTFTRVDNKDSNSEESVLRELQGAHWAQLRRNKGDKKESPAIRLLLANSGSQSKQWRHTFQELERQREKENIVAVAGLGPSTTDSEKAVRRLSKSKYATVSSIMTADSIRDIEGFVRVAPTNADEARAAANYLKDEGWHSATLVEDKNTDNLYAKTLSKAFRSYYPENGDGKDGDGKDGYELVPDEPQLFDSSTEDWARELEVVTGNLCHRESELVYFAGRGVHLTRFLDALADRQCQDHEFTVVTGDDTSNLTSDELRKATETKVEVLYTGVAHPDMWEGNSESAAGVQPATEPAIRGFREGGFLDEKFPDEPRDDGQAMVAHDSVMTVAKGLSLVRDEASGESVGRMFDHIKEASTVSGASGRFWFRNNGVPANKAVPILKLNAEAGAEFVELAVPTDEQPKQPDGN